MSELILSGVQNFNFPSDARIARRGAVEWRTIGLIAVCYAIWFAGGITWPAAPLFAIVLVALAVTLHSSLQHEALHGHPTRNARLNESLVLLPIGLVTPYRRYKQMHLAHHGDERLTDPIDDPESYYRVAFEWQRLPQTLRILLSLNNSLLGRVTLGPALATIGFLLAEAKRITARKNDRQRKRIRKAWAIHIVGIVAVLAIIAGVFHMPLWAYLIGTYLGMSVLAIRSFCEHQWAENPDERTIIVEKTMLGILFLNNNLHLVHHKHPRVPWYELPALYRDRRAEWHVLNNGYVFRGYGQLLRSYGLKPKEPVAHPIRIER